MRQINNLDELRMAQIELQHQIQMKEMELQAHAKSVKEMLNPMTYINLAISKISFVEQFVASFYKGYRTIVELVEKHRDKKDISQETD